MKVLKLTLKRKWFDMILRGEKKEEYRAIKPYWIARLCKTLCMPADTIINYDKCTHDPRDKYIKFDAVEFRNGYSSNSPTMLVEFKDVETGKGNPNWGAPCHHVYIIKLGKIIEKHNCERL